MVNWKLEEDRKMLIVSRIQSGLLWARAQAVLEHFPWDSLQKSLLLSVATTPNPTNPQVPLHGPPPAAYTGPPPPPRPTATAPQCNGPSRSKPGSPPAPTAPTSAATTAKPGNPSTTAKPGNPSTTVIGTPCLCRSLSDPTDALPDSTPPSVSIAKTPSDFTPFDLAQPNFTDRKSTRLNSSHANISYAVFCLK